MQNNIHENEIKQQLREARQVGSGVEWEFKKVIFQNQTVDYILRKIKHKIPHDENNRDITDYIHLGKTVLMPNKILSDDEIAEKKAENLERAIRRARKAIHYACRQLSADHMVTLTTRENITDRKEFLTNFTKFIRLVREYTLINGELKKSGIKKDYKYVAVPELQERGAYHIHMAVNGKQDIKFLNACWYVALGGTPQDTGKETKGAVNVQYRIRRFSNSETAKFKTFGIVRYMTKYIAKSFEQDKELGQHRYSIAKNIDKPETTRGLVTACFSNNGQTFIDAMIEIIDKAKSENVQDFEIYNRGDDLFLLRGIIDG